MQMQGTICIAQYKCNNQVFMSFLLLLPCFQNLIPLYSSMLPSWTIFARSNFSPHSIFVSNFSPFVVNFHKRWHHLGMALDNTNLVASGWTSLESLEDTTFDGDDHLKLRITWTLLDCFHELLSLWFELVNSHKHLTQFEPSSSFFTCP
jgi:hypothetical protein